MRYVESINRSLHDLLDRDERVIVIGEDIVDPYGGAFKVTDGLSTQFPQRVLGSPISEAGIVGIASGMAIRGLIPIVEIMFGDFLGLAFDQILNHASKYREMYAGKVDCHMVIRTPMGGYRGYGPTHSQTIEKHFVGIPGITVLAPSRLHDVGALLKSAVLDQRGPIIFIENKTDYAAEMAESEDEHGSFSVSRTGDSQSPTLRMTLQGAGPCDVSVLTYGGMLTKTLAAVQEIYLQHEIHAEVLVPSRIKPFDVDPVLQSVRQTETLVTVEEGSRFLGIGAEIIATVSENNGSAATRFARVAAKDSIIPASQSLEETTLPTELDIQTAILSVSRN